jgi:glycosyltransferase involved in cell wall biosynthesis
MAVSIGLPFFNAEAYLLDAIRSVFAQTYEDWELILIDDGSTDRSLEIAMSIKDPRVRVLSDGRNLKLACRLNQITQLARFDFIARMDADDLMPAERIAHQMKVLEQHPDVDLVSTGLISVDANDIPIGMRCHVSDTVTRGQLLKRIGCGIVHASVLVRRAWFQRNPYDPSVFIAQDYELWLRASSAGDLCVRTLKQPLYYVRELASASPEKMLRSYKMDRRSIMRHRKSLFEMRFVAKSLLKTIALNIMVGTGNFEKIVRMRSRGVVDQEMFYKFKNDVRVIRHTKVPGI